MQLEKVPATIVTGFLGSGKTTLLSNILKKSEGKRIAVIVNEFGEMDIDADVLRSCPLDCDDEESTNTVASSENGIYELSNGCICCSVEEDFLPVMKELVKRRDEIDHILIETSGLALPKPLVQAFNWPEIKQFFTVDAVITVVDGVAVSQGRFASDEDLVEAQRLEDESLDHDPSLEELLDDQLSAADLVIVSKNDLLDEDARGRVEKTISQRVSSSIKSVYIRDGEVPFDVIVGVEAAAEDKIHDVHNHHDAHHEHGAHHEHAHDHFDSFIVKLGDVDIDQLQVVLKRLLDENNIYRAKGFISVPGKAMRMVLQAVGERLDMTFDRFWAADEERQSNIVFIGKALDQVAITDAIMQTQLTN